MALGEILRNAREQKGLTASEVAESTHMKVQVIEDLEREDFRRIAAPIYGRGFVKLYAEHLQLDPEPLVRAFMELYAGARAPAVRLRRVDEQPETPLQGGSPTTRTVTGAAAAPQRQPVQARPAVRPLSAPAVAEETEEEAADRPAAPAPAPLPLVVEPEEPAADSDEPDLFRPQSLRPRPAAASAAPPAAAEAPARRRKLPVFMIGGRLEGEAPAEAPPDEAAHARRHARVQAFVDGFRELRDGVESKLPALLPRKHLLALCGAGVALLALMAVGIGLLFKMTGASVRETPGVTVEVVAPPPDLYAD